MDDTLQHHIASLTKAMADNVTGLNAIADFAEALVDKAKTSSEISDLLILYFHLHDGYSKIDTARKRIYAVKDRVDKGEIPSLLDARDVDKVQVASIARSFYPLQKYSASLLDRDKGHEWLRGHDLGDIITPTVNAGTLATALREYELATGKTPPEDIFTFKSYYTTGISKYTPKG